MRRIVNILLIFIISIMFLGCLDFKIDTLEELENALLKSNANVKTFTADFISDVNINNKNIKISGKGSGTLEYKKNKDGFNERTDTKSNEKRVFSGKYIINNKSYVMTVTNNKYNFLYTDTNNNGVEAKKAKKYENNGKSKYSPYKGMFESVEKVYDLKILPEEKINNRKVYVLEFIPKEKDDILKRQINYFDKKTGFIIQRIQEDNSGKIYSKFIYNNITVNKEIKNERFIFTVPDDVEFVDYTLEENKLKLN